MEDFILLKELIDEDNYPYFTDTYLQQMVNKIGIERGVTIESIAYDLIMMKSGIPEIKLGDVTIPSPRDHFLMLARNLRGSNRRAGSSRNMVRADEQ